MLCSNCYKKIPRGEEVEKSGLMPWRSWGTFCKKCAKQQDRKDHFF